MEAVIATVSFLALVAGWMIVPADAKRTSHSEVSRFEKAA